MRKYWFSKLFQKLLILIVQMHPIGALVENILNMFGAWGFNSPEKAYILVKNVAIVFENHTFFDIKYVKYAF